MEHISKENAVYFNLFGNFFVYYPEKFILPLSGLILVLFIGNLFLGFKRDRLTSTGIFFGAIYIFLSAALISIGVFLIGYIGITLGPVLALMEFRHGNESPRIILLLMGLWNFAIALVVLHIAWRPHRIRVDEIIVGTQFVWLLLLFL